MSAVEVLRVIETWPVDSAAAAVVGPSGVVAGHGDLDKSFTLASVTKPLVARATHIAIEEGAVELDTPAGPPGSTIRHLLAHASGVSMRSADVLARPGQRRIYSNYGFELLARAVEAAADIEFASYLTEAVFEPLQMAKSTLVGGAETAGFGGVSTVADLAAFAAELLRPTLVSEQLHQEAVTVQFPGLDGVLPGFGVQRPNDWGLGFEIRDGKSPHWTGSANSPATFGHFGQSGTFLWVDPVADLALVVLTDRDFGEWTYPLWPAISDGVLRENGTD
ncbi:serine hydrolase domain-containing protein [Mycolicibacterium fortuitum]|jgi:CubicO group peptidase (beta-lactamase class C family)|uniref:Serine hydrolase domain-containing protein n=2 Tax=Mycolicibacterium fortuitum TaxID=1766 RepID=A0AAE4V8Z3_MYCFO|nr:serine hydrolase domain-containing protein [Mycolicibacterium fortuitum]MCA4754053.1 beta-lactamase family protein [Mycolicibacterium fortuitum]MCV7141479.1 beta-lactamase family protein [Mycolicibacterium fortuitum]MDV7189676.1 serine hydrolase domain-containing protein [Mycolicibacterium fortuitum]MDV7203027.1 serine hydrolase domain-containing protein [Mycolicibacterium fortuitum]MDV7224757.1 serine hydrolase domain-containing protein [Mycolicibacterium fortuitum]